MNGRPCGRAHGQARMRADRRCPVGGTDERIALHGLVQAYYWNIPTQTNRSLDLSVPATFILFLVHIPPPDIPATPGLTARPGMPVASWHPSPERLEHGWADDYDLIYFA